MSWIRLVTKVKLDYKSLVIWLGFCACAILDCILGSKQSINLAQLVSPSVDLPAELVLSYCESMQHSPLSE